MLNSCYFCFTRRLYGCYEYIDGGLINNALVDLTGGISEIIEMQGGKSLEQLYKTLLSDKRMNTLMGGAIFVSIMLMQHDERTNERNVLFNDALNTFYLRLYGVRHMVKDHSDSEKGNPLPPHRLLFPISSKGSFICTIPQTG